MTGYGQHVVQMQLTAHAGELVARRFPAETAPPPLLPRGGVRVAWRIDDAGGCVQFGHRANAVERVEEPQGGGALGGELWGNGARFGMNSKV